MAARRDAYYVGVEAAGLAIPGAPRPLRALCVAPMGMEEGTSVDVPSNEIGLVVGQPAKFRFFVSSTRKQDQPGVMLQRWAADELQEIDPVIAELPADDAIDEPFLPVRFQTRISELGMFELWCVSSKTGGQWKLEFSAREQRPSSPRSAAAPAVMESTVERESTCRPSSPRKSPT